MKPYAQSPPRVLRSPQDDRYQAGHPAPPKGAGTGYVTSVQDDTVTVKVSGENVAGVIPLGEMPPVRAIVEVEDRGDLLVIPLWFPGPVPMVCETAHPTAINFGTSTVLSLVGGSFATIMADGSDATYLKVANLDGVNVRDVLVTFPSFNLPGDLYATWHMSARYQQVSGISVGRPGLGLPLDGGGGVGLSMLTFAGPMVEEDGYPVPLTLGGTANQDGTPYDPANPVQVWTLGMEFDQFAPCDFRIYEMSVTACYADPEAT